MGATKREVSTRGYSWAALFPGDTGTWPSRLGGVSNETVKYGREFCGTWSRE
jgi:hypothetical protein